MSKFKHVIAVIVLTVLSTLGIYFFFKDFLFRLPVQASVESLQIDQMIEIHFFVQAFLFSVIMVIMLYAVYAFRRQPGDEEDAPHVHGNATLEILWTVVPTLAVIAFGVYGAVVLNDLLAPEPNERIVEVEGRRWLWRFAYPDIEGKTDGALGLLVNEPVVLRMHSIDVIHSFWVPEFRVKQDLLPVADPETDYYELRFTPTMEGEFKVRCAEICGGSHATMVADVLVMNQEDYDAWREVIGNKPSDEELALMEPAARGKYWSEEEFGCVGCHSIDGNEISGPTWLGLYNAEEELADGTTIIADHEYLYESILMPRALIVAGFDANAMPIDFEDQFAGKGFTIEGNDDPVDIITSDLIAYIQSLEEDAEASE